MSILWSLAGWYGYSAELSKVRLKLQLLERWEADLVEREVRDVHPPPPGVHQRHVLHAVPEAGPLQPLVQLSFLFFHNNLKVRNIVDSFLPLERQVPVLYDREVDA